MSAMGKKGMPRIACAALSLVGAIVIASCSMSAPTITAPRYALVYGVSTYYSSVGEGEYVQSNEYRYFNLSYSDDDAKDMSDRMTKQGWKIYKRIKGSAGVDQPTKANMQADILSIAAQATSDSTVLVYFSGHGTSDNNGTAYIVPYRGISDNSTPTVDLSKCISPSDLNSMLSVLPTKNVIVIFDTCYSGGFVSSNGATDASPQNYSSMQSYSAFSSAISNFGNLLVANASASGVKAPIVISAAGSAEFSYDNGTDIDGTAMHHGVFTYYLLKAAVSGDSDGDGAVTTTEAYAYTATCIKTWAAASTSNSAFLPHISGDTRDLVLFTN